MDLRPRGFFALCFVVARTLYIAVLLALTLLIAEQLNTGGGAIEERVRVTLITSLVLTDAALFWSLVSFPGYAKGYIQYTIIFAVDSFFCVSSAAPVVLLGVTLSTDICAAASARSQFVCSKLLPIWGLMLSGPLLLIISGVSILYVGMSAGKRREKSSVISDRGKSVSVRSPVVDQIGLDAMQRTRAGGRDPWASSWNDRQRSRNSKVNSFDEYWRTQRRMARETDTSTRPENQAQGNRGGVWSEESESVPRRLTSWFQAGPGSLRANKRDTVDTVPPLPRFQQTAGEHAMQKPALPQPRQSTQPTPLRPPPVRLSPPRHSPTQSSSPHRHRSELSGSYVQTPTLAAPRTPEQPVSRPSPSSGFSWQQKSPRRGETLGLDAAAKRGMTSGGRRSVDSWEMSEDEDSPVIPLPLFSPRSLTGKTQTSGPGTPVKATSRGATSPRDINGMIPISLSKSAGQDRSPGRNSKQIGGSNPRPPSGYTESVYETEWAPSSDDESTRGFNLNKSAGSRRSRPSRSGRPKASPPPPGNWI